MVHSIDIRLFFLPKDKGLKERKNNLRPIYGSLIYINEKHYRYLVMISRNEFSILD